MPDPATPESAPAPPPPERRRKRGARRLAEHYKLAAAAFDRASTVVLAGAVLAPAFQHKAAGTAEIVGWLAVAACLHATAHYFISLIAHEDRS